MNHDLLLRVRFCRFGRIHRGLLLLLVGAALGFAPQAQAQTGSTPPLYVLTLRTEDADDQADALTQALRARVRRASGWTLAETRQSFDTLAIALRCPARPDATCLLRIGDQLHAAHYIWGSLVKGPTGQVVAELHFWRRGKPEVTANAAYSDALREAGDPRLQGIADTLFAELTGAHASGTLVVHAGAGRGTVFVDDAPMGALQDGSARIQVDEGAHTVVVRVPGMRSEPVRVQIVRSGEREIEIPLEPAASEPDEVTNGPSIVRPVLGYGAVAVGAALLVAAVVEGVAFSNDKHDNDEDRKSVPRSVADVCATPVNAPAVDACAKSGDAKTAAALGWTFGAVGAAGIAAGIWLIAGDAGDREAHASSARFEIVPRIGPREQSLTAVVRF